MPALMERVENGVSPRGPIGPIEQEAPKQFFDGAAYKPNPCALPSLRGRVIWVAYKPLALKDNEVLRSFLELSGQKQGARALDPDIAIAVKAADQEEVVNAERDHNLLLELASSKEHAVRQLAKHCLNGGANPASLSSVGSTALHYAIGRDDVGLVTALLENGASLQQKTKDGFTPLDFLPGKFQVIEELLAQGYDLTQAETQNGEPLWLKVVLGLMGRGPIGDRWIGKILGRKPDLGGRVEGRTLFTYLVRASSRPRVQSIIQHLVLSGQAERLRHPKLDRLMREVAASSCINVKIGMTEENDVPFLAALAHSRWAILDVDPSYSLLGFLRACSAEEPFFANALKGVSAETIDALTEIGKLKEGETLAARRTYLERAESLVSRVEEQIFPHAQALRTQYEQDKLSYFTLRSLLGKWIEKARQQPSLLRNLDGLDPKAHYYLAEYLLEKREATLFSLYTSSRTDPNVMLSQLLLDKTWNFENTPYDIGSNLSETTSLLFELLTKVSQGLSDPLLQGEKALVDHDLLPLLSQCALWDQLSEANEKDLGKEIAWRMAKLQIGERILLPTGDKTHATLLLVEKTSGASAILTLYNTGSGLGKKRRYPDSLKYQTYQQFESVPLSSLSSPYDWDWLFALKRTARNMDRVHEHIFGKLCRGGAEVPLSQNPIDYEDRQWGESCAMQAPMAFLRHQFITRCNGTKLENYASYKIVKAMLLPQAAKSRNGQVNVEIQGLVKRPLEKQAAERLLFEIACSEERCGLAVEELNLQWLKELKRASSPKVRYALLRRAAAIEAQQWLGVQKAPSQVSEGQALALALFRHHQR